MYIEGDTDQGRLTKVKLLGKSMRNAPSSDIQDYLYQRADKIQNLLLICILDQIQL